MNGRVGTSDRTTGDRRSASETGGSGWNREARTAAGVSRIKDGVEWSGVVVVV